MRHDLKLIELFFQPVWDKKKTFEVRRDDRGYQVGDTVYLMEYDAQSHVFSGRRISARVTYVLTAQQFPVGLQPGYVVLGLDDIDRIVA